MSFSDLSVTDWSGDVRRTFEVAYAMSIDIYDREAGAYKTGCSVSSSVSSRRDVTVNFVAQVPSEQVPLAATAAESLNAATLVSSFAAAKTALGTSSVAAPTLEQIGVLKPTTTMDEGSGSDSGNDDRDSMVDTLAGLGALVGLLVVCGACYAYTRRGHDQILPLNIDNWAEPRKQDNSALKLQDMTLNKARQARSPASVSPEPEHFGDRSHRYLVESEAPPRPLPPLRGTGVKSELAMPTMGTVTLRSPPAPPLRWTAVTSPVALPTMQTVSRKYNAEYKATRDQKNRTDRTKAAEKAADDAKKAAQRTMEEARLRFSPGVSSVTPRVERTPPPAPPLPSRPTPHRPPA